MPVAGDTFTVELLEAHLGWGEVRHTDSRPVEPRETYIKIPASDAYRIGVFRAEIFNCRSSDGRFTGSLRASGTQSKPEYAKQFHTDGALKDLANWLIDICNAKASDLITVTWTSPTHIELSHTSV